MAAYAMSKAAIQVSPLVERILITFAGIALFNALELLVSIAFTFTRHRGLYFWSMLLSTLGMMPYTVGLLFKFFHIIHIDMLSVAMIDVGWQLMVTGQSFVLYSRLHLVGSNRRIKRMVLGMIITNIFVSNVPTTVFVFGACSDHPQTYLALYSIWERLQLCLYSVQEMTISGLYVYEIMKMPKLPVVSQKESKSNASQTGRRIRLPRSRRIMRHLLYVNIMIIFLDVTLLTSEFIGQFELQTLYKAVVYSVKLKMEFRILNQLTEIAHRRMRESQMFFSDTINPLVDSPTSPMGTFGPTIDEKRPLGFRNPWERINSGFSMAESEIGPSNSQSSSNPGPIMARLEPDTPIPPSENISIHLPAPVQSRHRFSI